MEGERRGRCSLSPSPPSLTPVDGERESISDSGEVTRKKGKGEAAKTHIQRTHEGYDGRACRCRRRHGYRERYRRKGPVAIRSLSQFSSFVESGRKGERTSSPLKYALQTSAQGFFPSMARTAAELSCETAPTRTESVFWLP
jgi:hypothetical protein